jgi:hypothetical protein
MIQPTSHPNRTIGRNFSAQWILGNSLSWGLGIGLPIILVFWSLGRSRTVDCPPSGRTCFMALDHDGGIITNIDWGVDQCIF